MSPTGLPWKEIRSCRSLKHDYDLKFKKIQAKAKNQEKRSKSFAKPTRQEHGGKQMKKVKKYLPLEIKRRKTNQIHSLALSMAKNSK